MCDEQTKLFIKQTVENNTNRIKYDLLRSIDSVKKVSEAVKERVDHINGMVGDHQKRIRDLEEYHRSRKLDCPYGETIEAMSDSLLTSAALREFLNEQELKQEKIQLTKDTRMRWIIGAIGIIFTVVTIIVNVVIYLLERSG